MSFKVIPTPIHGCAILEKPIFKDDRGAFFKMFEASVFEKLSPGLKLREVFFSTSKKNVLRGLHFQMPPQDHAKVVSCLQGKILDVVLDLRQNSPTENQAFGFELDDQHGRSILIPRGCAHGFYSLEDNSLVGYLVETAHSPEHDRGILWSSIDFKWPGQNPILSARDSQFPSLKDFKTSFHL